jgi:hypothetical protein
MPYTKEELKNVDFYTEFVSKLRTSYLEDLQEFATIGFRKNNILYSFEDIISSTGIEDVDVSNSSLYYDYLTKEQQELSKTLNTQSYPRYIKNNSLEKIVDRSISELATEKFADVLPAGSQNGDVITNEDPANYDRWLIQNNQKRKFVDLAVYYGKEYALSTLVTLTDNQIATIPDGEPIG